MLSISEKLNVFIEGVTTQHPYRKHLVNKA